MPLKTYRLYFPNRQTDCTAVRSRLTARPHQRGVGASEHERPSPERHGGGNGGKHAHERMSEAAAAEEEEEEGEAQS